MYCTRWQRRAPPTPAVMHGQAAVMHPWQHTGCMGALQYAVMHQAWPTMIHQPGVRPGWRSQGTLAVQSESYACKADYLWLLVCTTALEVDSQATSPAVRKTEASFGDFGSLPISIMFSNDLDFRCKGLKPSCLLFWCDLEEEQI